MADNSQALKNLFRQQGFRGGPSTERPGYFRFALSASDLDSGRRIFLKDTALQQLFLFTDDNFFSTELLKRMKQLSAAAGSFSHTKVGCGFSHVEYIKGGRIHYNIVGTEVYIEQIDLLGADDTEDKIGLYHLSRNPEGSTWEVDRQHQRTNIKGQFAAINGSVPNLNKAVEAIPPIVEKAYESEKSKVQAEGVHLFYNPPTTKRILGADWLTPKARRGSRQEAAFRLAHLLRETQYTAGLDKSTVKWIVHGSGDKILFEALEKLPGVNLSRIELLFTNPSKLVHLKFDMLKAAGIKLHDNVIQYADGDIRSLHTRAAGYSIGKAIINYDPGNEKLKERGEVLQDKFVDDVGTAVKTALMVAPGVYFASNMYHAPDPGPYIEGLTWGAVSVALFKSFFLYRDAKVKAYSLSSNAKTSAHQRPFDDDRKIRVAIKNRGFFSTTKELKV